MSESDVASKADWIARVLGIRLSDARETQDDPGAQDLQALKQELAALIGRIPEAAGNDAAHKTTLSTLASDANGAIKAGDAGAAADLVAQLASALATEPAKNEPVETEPAAEAPIVGLWADARDAGESQLVELYATLRGPGHPVLAAAADRIETALSGYRVGLTEALKDVDGDAARQKALQAVATCEADIAADVNLNAAENNPFGVPISIRATWGAALEAIKQRLAGA